MCRMNTITLFYGGSNGKENEVCQGQAYERTQDAINLQGGFFVNMEREHCIHSAREHR